MNLSLLADIIFVDLCHSRENGNPEHLSPAFINWPIGESVNWLIDKEVKKIMATVLGDITSYKRLYMQFRDSAAKTINLTLNNPKNVDDGDYVDFAAQDVAIEGVMDTIIAKNVFHNNGNDLVAKVNARILDYKSTDVMDV